MICSVSTWAKAKAEAIADRPRVRVRHAKYPSGAVGIDHAAIGDDRELRADRLGGIGNRLDVGNLRRNA